MAESGDDFLNGNGIIILILFFLMFAGGGLWGNNSNAVTQAELQTGLYNQTTDRNLSDIRTAQCSTDNLINTNTMATNNAISESKYESLLQFKDLANQMCQTCADLKATMIEQNQGTRDLIQANYINGLQTALSDAKTEISNNAQSANLLNVMGKWIANAPASSCCSCNS